MIDIDHLYKVYKSGRGIFDITLKVEKGEVFGFIGPNGAGKTTTIRQLMGFTNADSGSCSIGGKDTRKQAEIIQRDLGYVPGEISYFENMTGNCFMDFMTGLRGGRGDERRIELCEFFELENDRPLKKMSKGMKQKVALITAFMHDPDILLLDEPSSGLDPLMQKRFVELILSEKKRGKTIFLSSHTFDEVERTCDRAAIIREGHIAAIEDISRLRSQITKSCLVTFSEKNDMLRIRNSGLAFKELDETKVEIFIEDNYSKMINTLADCSVTNMDMPQQGLEQIFLKYYGKEGV